MKQSMATSGDRGEKDIVVGCKVTIQGLVGAAHHNGKEGEVLRFDKAKGRWGVKLDIDDEVMPLPS